VCRCGICNDASYVTASTVEVAINKKGETTVNLRPLVANGKLSPEEMRSLQTFRDGMHNVSQVSDGSLSAS